MECVKSFILLGPGKTSVRSIFDPWTLFVTLYVIDIRTTVFGHHKNFTVEEAIPR